MGKKTKSSRIKAERKRLEKVTEDLPEKVKCAAAGILDEMAYMRIELEDTREDLNENGRTEMFSQGDQEPYERIRPKATDYNNLVGKYVNAFKEICKKIPEEKRKEQETDGFDAFVSGRDEV